MFNPGFDEYSYKFSYDSEGNVKDVSLSKAEYAPDDFDGMDDIKPIQEQIDKQFESEIPALYQKEICKFMYQQSDSYFRDLIINCLQSDNVLQLKQNLEKEKKTFETLCLKQAKKEIDDRMLRIIQNIKNII